MPTASRSPVEVPKVESNVPIAAADNVPENEWNETLNKARGLLKAIELAEARIAQHS